MTVLGNVGVVVETALMRTGLSWPWALAHSSEEMIIAAPPSDVAQMWSSRSGSATTGDAITSSAVNSLR